MATPKSVHFVGSIALDTVDDVFRTCGHTLGRRLKRIPDGEPGGRRLWISWQYPLLRASPYLAPAEVAAIGDFRNLRIADGVDPADIGFGELGYAREARVSYQDFKAARHRGDLPENVKFQVSLPTPAAVIMAFLPGQDGLAVLGPYTEAMLREVQSICDAIPHEDLCIQWDVCIEMVLWDGQPSIMPPLPNKEAIIPPALGRLCDAVPDDVEVGIHLCYGDYDAKHFIEPQDAARMVSLANAIAGAARHPLAYLHMPVPIGRDDDAYFGPLKDLKLDPGTEIYLGLVHEDGAEATKRRIEAASKVLPEFGIATECGIARQRTPERVTKLIEIHAAASDEPVEDRP
jgi:hypothetical protein